MLLTFFENKESVLTILNIEVMRLPEHLICPHTHAHTPHREPIKYVNPPSSYMAVHYSALWYIVE